ncbi:uncharacterized protein LOC127801425 isoform X2 [Diospyros lotus]|uniref:uncharacterized protein LOC127801425 isoform X2 n=1 Tax=Diospyros lotus TaxID=55363 RepID=UPI002257C1E3|nr:uncharacterized protein LOC127801425 isoform X2 [Diospyros lotus]
MPSPVITSSSSDTSISKARSPHTYIPASSHSSYLAESKTSASAKKLGNLITRRSTSSSKNSGLTEENLAEFNRIDDILYDQKRSSPYYYKLTDSSLFLNRQKASDASPGRDSNATSSISSGSKPSLVVRMQGWKAYFNSHGKEEKAVEVQNMISTVSTRGSKHVLATSSSSISSSSSSRTEGRTTTTTLEKELDLEGAVLSVGMTANEYFLVKKSLRERDSEPLVLPSLWQLPPSSPARPQEYASPPVVAPSREAHQSTPPSKLISVSSSPCAKPSPPAEQPPTQQSLPSPQPLPGQTLAPSVQPFASLPQIAETTPKQERPPPSPAPTSTQTSVPSPQKEAQTSPENSITILDQKITQTINERAYVWADKYRPQALKDFICHKKKVLELHAVAKPENCGHFIFEGPTGVGKKTMIWAMLREAFGADRVQTREECKLFLLKGEAVASIKVSVKISMQHVEVSLSEVKGYEKHVIVELIQETIDRISKKAIHCNQDTCRVIILYEADKLSADALQYIKWQLERHSECTKVFFCCSDASKLQPIMSLCHVVKLLPPSNEEIVEVLEFIAKQEGIYLSNQLAERIANNSKNNLRQAIRSFEATWQANSSLSEDQEILTGWEDEIANIAKNIVEEQSPKQLYNIRGKLQNLIEHNVSPEFIFEALVGESKKFAVEEFQPQIDSLYEHYKKQIQKRHEKTLRRHNDPVKRNFHHFLTIEASCLCFWMLGVHSLPLQEVV